METQLKKLGRITLLASLVASLGACAVREDDPYAVRVREVEARLANVERILDSGSMVKLLAEIEGVQNELRELRGQVETLRYDLDGMRQRQRDVYLDLDRRLQALESGSGGGAAPASGNDRDAYQAGFSLLREARYEEAKEAFQAFIDNYPESALVPNAWYWLGEVNYVNKDFESAVGQFRKVVEEFPQSSKAPDAWLKLGYCHYELGQWDKAREALQSVARQYPEDPAAGLASERLERMTREGH
ncbi:MAG TPA: tol-pal system protein YbgF [Gammaproteobacteria bacterium]